MQPHHPACEVTLGDKKKHFTTMTTFLFGLRLFIWNTRTTWMPIPSPAPSSTQSRVPPTRTHTHSQRTCPIGSSVGGQTSGKAQDWGGWRGQTSVTKGKYLSPPGGEAQVDGEWNARTVDTLVQRKPLLISCTDRETSLLGPRL